jgi:hypothetical protein
MMQWFKDWAAVTVVAGAALLVRFRFEVCSMRDVWNSPK